MKEKKQNKKTGLQYLAQKAKRGEPTFRTGPRPEMVMGSLYR